MIYRLLTKREEKHTVQNIQIRYSPKGNRSIQSRIYRLLTKREEKHTVQNIQITHQKGRGAQSRICRIAALSQL